jgi:hypothetical protein
MVGFTHLQHAHAGQLLDLALRAVLLQLAHAEELLVGYIVVYVCFKRVLLLYMYHSEELLRV